MIRANNSVGKPLPSALQNRRETGPTKVPVGPSPVSGGKENVIPRGAETIGLNITPELGKVKGVTDHLDRMSNAKKPRLSPEQLSSSELESKIPSEVGSQGSKSTMSARTQGSVSDYTKRMEDAREKKAPSVRQIGGSKFKDSVESAEPRDLTASIGHVKARTQPKENQGTPELEKGPLGQPTTFRTAKSNPRDATVPDSVKLAITFAREKRDASPKIVWRGP